MISSETIWIYFYYGFHSSFMATHFNNFEKKNAKTYLLIKFDPDCYIQIEKEKKKVVCFWVSLTIQSRWIECIFESTGLGCEIWMAFVCVRSCKWTNRLAIHMNEFRLSADFASLSLSLFFKIVHAVCTVHWTILQLHPNRLVKRRGYMIDVIGDPISLKVNEK